MEHGIFVNRNVESVAAPVVSNIAVPFVIGAAPIQSAANAANVGVPTLCNSWDDFIAKFGYSDDWAKYNLCEFAYSQFKLYHRSPVIFCNLLDPASMNEAVAGEDVDLTSGKCSLPFEAIESTVVVKLTSSGDALTKDTDYTLTYVGSAMVVSVIDGGEADAATSLYIAYSKVTAASINAAAVVAGMEKVELCMAATGLVPDLLCAPGYSAESTVAAAMVLKAESINGMFAAKALIDGSGETPSAAISAKAADSSSAIICWPKAKNGTKTFHLSTHYAGVIGITDAGSGTPYESPSNKAILCDSLLTPTGSEYIMTSTAASTLDKAGIVTAMSFSGRWLSFGNYTAAYPNETGADKAFIAVSRMMDWIQNSIVLKLWEKLDAPVSSRYLGSVIDTINIWLNGLVGAGYLYGASIEAPAEKNTVDKLTQGIVTLSVKALPPSPGQEIDIDLVYDATLATAEIV